MPHRARRRRRPCASITKLDGTGRITSAKSNATPTAAGGSTFDDSAGAGLLSLLLLLFAVVEALEVPLLTGPATTSQ